MDVECNFQFVREMESESENADVIDKLKVKCVVTEFQSSVYPQMAYTI